MPKDIVIIPASGQIEFSGSSTHHNVLTVDSSSIRITTDEFRIVGGNIVAENFVVSSSVTHLTSSAMSGSTIFGNTTDDTHQFTGSLLFGTSSIDSVQHITASGNISASGTIIGSNISGTNTGDQDLSGLAVADGGAISEDTFVIGSDGSTAITDSGVTLKDSGATVNFGTLNISSSGFISTKSHITASGNISSSGTIQSTGNISTDGSITATSADINGNVDIDGGNLTVGTALQFTNGGIFNFGGSLADGRITWDTGYASLYGLASNKLRLGSYNQQGVLTISSSHENTMVISGSSVGIGTTSPGEVLEVVGNISSSGTINAEHFFSSDDAVITDDLNVGGDISASGALKGLTLDVNGTSNFANTITIETSTDAMLNFKATDDSWSYMQFLQNDGDRIAYIGTDSDQNRLILNATENGANEIELNTTTVDINANVDISGTISNVLTTHITASGNISASGIITAEGLSISDDFSLTDDLTVGGNISASGNIIASSISSSGDIVLADGASLVVDNGDIINWGNDNSFGLQVLRLGQNYGYIAINGGTGWTSGLVVHNSGSDNAKNNARVSIGSTQAVTTSYPPKALSVEGDISASDDFYSPNFSTQGGNVTASGNITAGGNISSSGTGTNIFAGNIDFDGDTTISTVGGSDDISINPDAQLNLGTGGSDEINIGRQSGTADINMYANTSTVAARFVTSTITLNHPITASKNISSSGTLISNEINTIGNITASGNISSSGTLDAGGVTDNLVDLIVAELDNDSISGDKINGGTIGSVTITQLGGALDVNNENITNIDVDSGTIDGTVIGGASAAAGTFTTLNATSLNVTSITSSIVTSSILQTEGSNIFGDTISDTHTFNGHITASGDISASGNLYLGDDQRIYLDDDNDTWIESDADDKIRFIASSTQVATIKNSNFGVGDPDPQDKLVVRGDISQSGDFITKGNITASGNLEVAGNISGSVSSDLTLGGSIYLKTDSAIKFSGNNDQIYWDGDDINISVDDGDQFQVRPTKVQSNYPLHVIGESAGNGHITASGNISGSGTLDITGATTLGSAISDIHRITGSIEATGSGNLIQYSVADTVSSVDGSIKSNAFKVHSYNASTSNSKLSFQLNGFTFLSVSSTNGAAFSSLYIGEDLTSAGGYESIVLPSIARLTWGDSVNTYIEVNSDSPEDLRLLADDDIVFAPDDDLIIQAGSTTYATFFGGEKKLRLNSTSTSAPTSVLDVSGDITATNITASNISSSGTVTANTLSVTSFSPTNLSTGNITASGNISASGTQHIFGSQVVIGGITPATNAELTVVGDISASNGFSTRDNVTNNLARLGTAASSGDEYLASLQPGNFDVKLGDPQGASNEQILFVNNTNQQTELTTSLFTISNDLEINGDMLSWGEETSGKVAIFNTSLNGQTAITATLSGANGGLYLSGSKAFLGFDSDADGTTKYATPSNKGLTVEGDISASNFSTHGHITASGNISSSANIIGDKVYVGSNLAISYNSGYRFGFQNTVPVQFGKLDNPFTFSGNITASGNISGSSTTNITIGGDLTCDDVIADDITGTLQTGVQTNITRVGTITHGTWQATDIDGQYLQSRFQLSFDYNGRLSAGDKWYTKNSRGSFAQLNSQLSAGSNPSGSDVTYLSAGRYSSYTAPRACKLIRSQVVMLNYTNDDDVVLGIYKGTTVHDSSANITLTQIGTDIGGAMTEDENFMYQTDYSSGNTLAAGDFILFTIHTQTYTSTSYPYISINLEFQYT